MKTMKEMNVAELFQLAVESAMECLLSSLAER